MAKEFKPGERYVLSRKKTMNVLGEMITLIAIDPLGIYGKEVTIKNGKGRVDDGTDEGLWVLPGMCKRIKKREEQCEPEKPEGQGLKKFEEGKKYRFCFEKLKNGKVSMWVTDAIATTNEFASMDGYIVRVIDEDTAYITRNGMEYTLSPKFCEEVKND